MQVCVALARHEFLSAFEWGERAVKYESHCSYAYGVMADAQIELGRYSEAVEKHLSRRWSNCGLI